MKETTIEQRYSPQEVCDLLHISHSTLYRYIRQGKIDARGVEKMGRNTTRIRASVINKFLHGCAAKI